MSLILPQILRDQNEKNIGIITELSENDPVRNKALLEMPFLNIVIQDGEYCNFKCGHCYGDFGPDKKQRSPLKLFEIIRDQLEDTQIQTVSITDGEPTFDIDRLSSIIKIMQPFPLGINSNGWFANNEGQAEHYFSEMKNAGFSLQLQKARSTNTYLKDTFALSIDDFHKGSYKRLIHFIKAYTKIFAKYKNSNQVDKGAKSLYQDLFITHGHIDYLSPIKNFYDLVKSLWKIERKLKNEFSGIHSNLIARNSTFIRTSEGLIIQVYRDLINPEGRAIKNFKFEKPRVLMPEDLQANHEVSPTIYVKYNGDTYWGSAFSCLKEGRKLGNVYQNTLSDMIDEVTKNPIFQLERTVGVKGLYQKIYTNGIPLEGNRQCDICNQIFSNHLLEKIVIDGLK